MIWYVLCTWCGLLIGLLVGRHWGDEAKRGDNLDWKVENPLPMPEVKRPRGVQIGEVYIRQKGPAAPINMGDLHDTQWPRR